MDCGGQARRLLHKCLSIRSRNLHPERDEFLLREPTNEAKNVVLEVVNGSELIPAFGQLVRR